MKEKDRAEFARADAWTIADLQARSVELRKLAKQAVNGWACHARTKIENAEIARLHKAIDNLPAALRSSRIERETELQEQDHARHDQSGVVTSDLRADHRECLRQAKDVLTEAIVDYVQSAHDDVGINQAMAAWAKVERAREHLIRAVQQPPIAAACAALDLVEKRIETSLGSAQLSASIHRLRKELRSGTGYELLDSAVTPSVSASAKDELNKSPLSDSGKEDS